MSKIFSLGGEVRQKLAITREEREARKIQLREEKKAHEQRILELKYQRQALIDERIPRTEISKINEEANRESNALNQETENKVDKSVNEINLAYREWEKTK